MNNSPISKILSPVWAIITVFATILTFIVGIGSPTANPDLKLVKTDKALLEKAIIAGQGITTDGKYYYTSGAMTALNMTGLAKWKADSFELIASKTDVVPKEYKENYGSNHVGGISYYNGLIYASVENSSKDYPLVITYDAETLTVTNVYKMPTEVLPNGIPWCAVDGQNGYLYCSQYRNVEKIAAFDLETMEFSHYINLSEKITNIQGAEVYENTLYLSCDDGDNTDTIYCADVKTGETSVFCQRTVPGLFGNEAEGMTVYPMADGSLYHIIDYDKTVGIYVRHYANS